MSEDRRLPVMSLTAVPAACGLLPGSSITSSITPSRAATLPNQTLVYCLGISPAERPRAVSRHALSTGLRRLAMPIFDRLFG